MRRLLARGAMAGVGVAVFAVTITVLLKPSCQPREVYLFGRNTVVAVDISVQDGRWDATVLQAVRGPLSESATSGELRIVALSSESRTLATLVREDPRVVHAEESPRYSETVRRTQGSTVVFLAPEDLAKIRLVLQKGTNVEVDVVIDVGAQVAAALRGERPGRR